MKVLRTGTAPKPEAGAHGHKGVVYGSPKHLQPHLFYFRNEDLRGLSFQEDAEPLIRGAVTGAGVITWGP